MLRVSVPNAIKSKSSGRGSFKTVFGRTAKFLFQFAQFLQQRFRRFIRARHKTGNRIHKLRRIPADNSPAKFATAKI